MESVTYNAFDEIMARDWLKALISIIRKRKILDKFNSQVMTISTYDDTLHIAHGIEILADMLGLELLEGEKVENYYQYYFLYDGVTFFQLSEERLVGFEDV